MLEANTKFEIEPALTVINSCQRADYVLFLDHCVCLLITSLQLYLQRDQANFNVKNLEQLICLYNNAHFNFMSQTEKLLDKLVAAQLMEPSFDIGLTSKLKIAKRFYQKAQTKWEIYRTTTNLDETVRHYFHNISSALIYCVDLHIDALRVCEAALLSYQRQILVEAVPTAAVKLQMEQAINFLTASKKQNFNFREIVVNANLHVGHDNILANLILALKTYLIPTSQLLCVFENKFHANSNEMSVLTISGAR